MAGSKRRIPLPKEYRPHISAPRGPDPFVWVKPGNLKAECIPVMLLCAFDIGDRQLRYWLANRGHFLFCVHRCESKSRIFLRVDSLVFVMPPRSCRLAFHFHASPFFQQQQGGGVVQVSVAVFDGQFVNFLDSFEGREFGADFFGGVEGEADVFAHKP